MGRIAITGAGSFLGGRLLRRLVDERDGDDVVVVDVAAPPPALGVRQRRVDLTEPGADEALLQVFRVEQVDAVAHLAFLTNPRRDSSYAHELESLGTLSLMAAAAAAGVKQVMLRSFTAVYGARGENPNFLVEERPLRAGSSLGCDLKRRRTLPKPNWPRLRHAGASRSSRRECCRFNRRSPNAVFTAAR